MKNTIGDSVAVTLFGESHGPMIGAVLDGMAPGIPVDEAAIAEALTRRRGAAALSTGRREADPFQIVSGVYNGKTTGTPLCLLIPNADTKSSDYDKTAALLRPSHADYTAQCKYHGYHDPHGGGHFSGRITAPLVAVGAIAMTALKNRGITVAAHIQKLGAVCDSPLQNALQAAQLQTRDFPTLDTAAGERMMDEILAAKHDADSIGGCVETAVFGLPAGVGDPWFDSVEGELSKILFAVPAVKGVQFGAGFAFASMRGSDANDHMRVENGQIVTATNHNGGVLGGITNGMPLVFSCAVKPTPSIGKPQQTVDFETRENAELVIQGRHDPCIVHRAVPVIEAVTALCLCDLLARRFGTDWLAGGAV